MTSNSEIETTPLFGPDDVEVAHKDAYTLFWRPASWRREEKPLPLLVQALPFLKIFLRVGRAAASMIKFVSEAIMDSLASAIIGLAAAATAYVASEHVAAASDWSFFDPRRIAAMILTFAGVILLMSLVPSIVRLHNVANRWDAWRRAFPNDRFDQKFGFATFRDQIHFGFLRVQFKYSSDWLLVKTENDLVLAKIRTDLIKAIETSLDRPLDVLIEYEWMDKGGLQPIRIVLDDDTFLTIHGAAFRDQGHRQAFVDGLESCRKTREKRSVPR